MKKGTRTANGLYLQSCLYRQLPFEMKPFTTLNEFLNIQAGVAPGNNVTPTVKCIGIGNGGLKPAVNGGLWSIQAEDHKASDLGHYNQLPFVLRTLDNDLSTVERARYALRRIETHNNTQYAAYYLRRLEAPTNTALLNVTTVNNGLISSTPFVPTSANLNPSVPAVSNTSSNTVNGSFLTAANRETQTFSPTDIVELLNVATVIYGDPNYAIISEVSIVSGVDKVVNSPSIGNTTISFNELICAQIVSFINTVMIAPSAANGSSLTFDLGASEPLLALG